MPPWQRLSPVSCAGRSSGLSYLTTIDHSAEARAVGLELGETQLGVFGNPHAGRPIMRPRH
jgi:uncharacterized protein (DUF302 family)